MSGKPEIANSVQTGNFKTNYHDYGTGDPVLLIHGSGPGVSSWANWSKVMPRLSARRRVLALDMLGFGYTERPDGISFSMDIWTKQVVDFLDAMRLDKVDVVGNSFGGALALSLAINYPDRARKIVLMGSMGVTFPITEGLDTVWGYQPTPDNMFELLNLFVFNKALATKELAQLRYDASIQPGFQESFSAMFPEPRQKSVDALAKNQDRISGIDKPVLIIHGRDDKVIPVEASYKIFSLIDDAQLHIFGKCGHWTQIEHTDKFVALVDNFLEEA